MRGEGPDEDGPAQDQGAHGELQRLVPKNKSLSSIHTHSTCQMSSNSAHLKIDQLTIDKTLHVNGTDVGKVLPDLENLFTLLRTTVDDHITAANDRMAKLEKGLLALTETVKAGDREHEEDEIAQEAELKSIVNQIQALTAVDTTMAPDVVDVLLRAGAKLRLFDGRTALHAALGVQRREPAADRDGHHASARGRSDGSGPGG